MEISQLGWHRHAKMREPVIRHSNGLTSVLYRVPSTKMVARLIHKKVLTFYTKWPFVLKGVH